jgi:hypothetical protein
MRWALLYEDQPVLYQCRMEAPFHLQSASLPFPVSFKAKCSSSEICRQHVVLQAWKTPTYKMEHMMEQRVNWNVCVKLQKPPSETLQLLKTVYGESPGKRSHGCQSPRSKQC